MRRTFLLFSLAMLFVATSSFAAVPSKINLQGRLTNSNVGLNGQHAAVFRLYDALTSGNLLWTENQSLEVDNGLFTTVLGQNNPFTASTFSGQMLWLETQVDGTTLSPRQPFVSVPYSFYSQRADTANVALSGTGGNELWSTDGVNVWRGSGNVGAGSSNPLEPLHIERGQGMGSSSLLMRSYIPGTGSYGLIHFQNTLATDQGIAAEIAAIRPSATWGQESDLVFSTNPGSSTPALAERMRIKSGGGINIANAIGVGPGTPWTSGGVFLDAGSQTTQIAWDNRANAGFQMYQAANSNVFNFTSSGGGSSETWNYISAGLGNLMTIGPTITMNRNVQINGNMTATGTKCRAVEGTRYGTLYYNAVESGNAIFMTSGRARLVNGRCHVDLDPKWLAGVTIDDHHPLEIASVVFYGPHREWYATPGVTGFDIIESRGTTSEFFWTVQARQKSYEDRYLDQLGATTAAAR